MGPQYCRLTMTRGDPKSSCRPFFLWAKAQIRASERNATRFAVVPSRWHVRGKRWSLVLNKLKRERGWQQQWKLAVMIENFSTSIHK